MNSSPTAVRKPSKSKFDYRAYIAIARPDHWFKNIFMILGVMLALFIEPQQISREWEYLVFLALIAACLVASSNYVLNEILDASKDKLHPTKRFRPVPSGKISVSAGYAEWIILGAAGLGIAFFINMPFFLSALALWVAGCLYNIPPIRTKEIPYLDVLSESLNNPIRLFLGWFALIDMHVPPLSLTISYWMAGAFFMGAKRFAEYKMIDDPHLAGQYRASFKHYNCDKLLISLLFYATCCSFFFGIFLIRYHLELILAAPFIAGFFAYYMKITLKPNSPVQNPEKLYKEFGFVLYGLFCLLIFTVLLFTSVPFLYRFFNIITYKINPLWTF